MKLRKAFNATLRMLLSVAALLVAIVLPGRFDGWLEPVVGVTGGVIGVLIIVYLWYPRDDGIPDGDGVS